MSEHTSNTTSGPDGEEWERAVGAAKTLLSSDCGWLELFTRAILEEKGVPYGKGLPNPEAPHIPEDKEIEEETMPGQGEPTPTAPEVPAGRHAAEPIRSGIPADAGETGNGYENPPEDATDRDDTPPKAGAEESDTRILPAPEGKTDLGRDESGDLDPRGQGTCPASSARECGAARPTIRTSPRSWKGSWPTCSATTRAHP